MKRFLILTFLIFAITFLSACASTQSKNSAWQRYQNPHQFFHSNEVSLGMQSQTVKKSWGEPSAIQHAGDPQLKNERWVYEESAGQGWGIRSSRILYFENGRLIGWETL